MHKPITAFLAVFLLSACGQQAAEDPDAPPLPTAATLGEQVVMTNAEFLTSEPYASADRERGASQAQICRACHTLGEGEAHMIGPNLFGFFGKPAANAEGFGNYSSVLSGSGIVWTPRALDAWLAQPAKFLPGNRMSFMGISSKLDRDALVAYLLEVTDDAQ